MRKTYTQIANIGNYYDNILLVNLYILLYLFINLYILEFTTIKIKCCIVRF